MKAIITPSAEKSIEKQTVAAPPSKSMAHRLLICAALAESTSVIKGLALSEDILATIDCLRALGAEIMITDPEQIPYAIAEVRGCDPSEAAGAVLYCRESGSTLRFMAPLAALSEEQKELSGSSTLLDRPLGVYEKVFAEHGASLEKAGDRIAVNGRLSGGEYRIPGDVSSQFVSGLLFALPLLSEDSVIRLEGNIESRPYIDMTIAALESFGVRASWINDSDISVSGCQRYAAREMTVEGDWSNAAFLLATGAEVTGLDDNSLQGDRACRVYFKRLKEEHAVIDISDCPDLGPVIMAFAAMHHGCRLIGTKRLRIKESDRGEAMKAELAKFGVDVDIEENSIDVGCGAGTPSEELCGHNDHRIVMALAVLCSRTGGAIAGAEAVRKSFPDFFEKYKEAGGHAELKQM